MLVPLMHALTHDARTLIRYVLGACFTRGIPLSMHACKTRQSYTCLCMCTHAHPSQNVACSGEDTLCQHPDIDHPHVHSAALAKTNLGEAQPPVLNTPPDLLFPTGQMLGTFPDARQDLLHGREQYVMHGAGPLKKKKDNGQCRAVTDEDATVLTAPTSRQRAC